MQDYHPHPMEWTNDKVARFWDYYGSHASRRESYFGYHSGRQLLDLLENRIDLKDKFALDFGCGSGYILNYLAERRIACAGLDFSLSSVEAAKELTKSSPYVKAVVQATQLPANAFKDGVFDLVLLTETIEHLLDYQIEDTFREIRRVLKPGGHLVVTTPNDEDLSVNEAHCSECGATFYRWQHMRKFTRKSLAIFLAQFGFSAEKCFATKLIQPRSFAGRLIEVAQKIYRRLLGRELVDLEPNLIFIGTK